MMIYRFLVVIFLCLCATSAFSLQFTIEPSAVRVETWDSTGGIPPAILTDGSLSTYIRGLVVGDTDSYDCEDFGGTDFDTGDSVILWTRASEPSSGNNKYTAAIIVGNDTTAGSKRNLGTGWTNYSDVFLLAPDGGAWTEDDINNLEVRFIPDNVATECRIAICSVQVFYKSSERTLMFPFKDDACLTSSNYDHDLVRKSFMQNDTAFTFVAGTGEPVVDYWKTGDQASLFHRMKNDDWETGGFGVFLDVVHVKADCSLQIVIRRYNSSCALQESTPSFPASGAKLLIDTTGHYEFQIPQHDWSSGACGDELAVLLQWTNVFAQPDDSVWIIYGTPFTYLETEVRIDIGGPCGGVSEAGECASQPTSEIVTVTPNQEGGKVEWVEVGSAGSLIAAIADVTDGNYMMEDVVDDTVQFQMGTLTEPSPFTSYDSATVHFRGQRKAGGKSVRVRIRIADSTNPTTEFCQSGNIKISKVDPTWGNDNTFTIYGAPSGVNACEGAFSTAEINGWEISFYTVQEMPGTNEARVTSVDLVLCYTFPGAGGEQNFRRIRLIKLGKLDDKTIWDEYFDQELVVNEEYETSVTFGMPSSEWVWGKW